MLTDHKAIEMIKQKSDFGTHRIKRWFNRLERFNFKAEYRKGETMVQADALSRSIDPDMKEKILQTHMEYTHRKDMRQETARRGHICTERQIRDILKDCDTCF